MSVDLTPDYWSIRLRPSDYHSFRYKYLQKPLEESALPSLLQYINRWPAAQKDKVAVAIGILMAQGLATAGCLQSLTKDHLIKNGTSQFLTGLTPEN